MSSQWKAVAMFAQEARLVFKWWLHELQDSWHAALTRVLPRHADQVWILITDRGAQARWRQNGQEHESAGLEIAASREADPWEPIVPLLAQTVAQVRAGTRTRVHLDLSRVLLRDIVLPEVAERDLPAIVALQVERVLPLAPDMMYIDWKIKERLPDRRRIVITVAATKREPLDRLRERITQAGLRVDDMSAGGLPEKPTFNFSRLPTSWQTAGWERRDRVLTFSLISLMLVWLGLLVGRMLYERHQITQIVADEHTRAQPARLLERQIRERAAPMRRVEHLLMTPTATDLIALLSQAIPADTWVYSAEISGGSTGAAPVVKLSGFTPVATMLVDSLSKSSGLQAVKLVKATGTSGGIGVDRFEISAQFSPSVSTPAKVPAR